LSRQPSGEDGAGTLLAAFGGGMEASRGLITESICGSCSSSAGLESRDERPSGAKVGVVGASLDDACSVGAGGGEADASSEGGEAVIDPRIEPMR